MPERAGIVQIMQVRAASSVADLRKLLLQLEASDLIACPLQPRRATSHPVPTP